MENDPDTVTLELLRDIERNRFESQRRFAARLGIAVGLANSYIRRCMKKGWIKMSKTPARRYAYYLTPKGFTEKSRLTSAYLGASFRLYRQARREFLDAFDACNARGWHALGLYGTGDLAEIAALSAREGAWAPPLAIMPDSPVETFVGLRVVQDLEVVRSLDAVLVTSIENPQEAYEALLAYLPAERIIAVPLLHVTRGETVPAPEPAGRASQTGPG